MLKYRIALALVLPFALVACDALDRDDSAPAPTKCPTEDSCDFRVDYDGKSDTFRLRVWEVTP
jgi:hypothetical protein